MTRITRIARITRILAAVAAIALVAGPVFAQGPRAANDAPDWRRASNATSTQAETHTRLRDPGADVGTDVAPVRDRVRDPAQHRVDGDDAAGRGPRPARGVATGAAFGPRHAALAEALGMTDEELRDAIAGGASWADLAEEAGLSLDEMPDRPQVGAAAPQGRMQQDAPQARRGGGRF